MGCMPIVDEETKLNRKIDKEQGAAAEERSEVVSLLLVGAGEAGKSTFLRQMTNIYGEPWPDSKKKKFAATIASNLLDGFESILTEMGESDSEELVAKLTKLTTECTDFLTPECVKFLLDLYKGDPRVKEMIQNRANDVQLAESFEYYVSRLSEYPMWGGEGWIPDVDDCIKARSRTSGVVKEVVVVEGVQFEIYDVGGQRSERRKWLHVFHEVTAAIYITSLVDYCQVLYEDRTKNRLQESFDLFREIANSNWLSNTPILLFLNKKDVFDRKFTEERIPLNVSGLFPEAPTDQDDPKAALKWFGDEFKSRRITRGRQAENEAKWFVHVTCATDQQNVEKVFGNCRTIIIKKNLDMAFGN